MFSEVRLTTFRIDGMCTNLYISLPKDLITNTLRKVNILPLC